jgi:hypothetical protein
MLETKGNVTMSNRNQYTLLHIANTAMAFAFFLLGFNGDGLLHKLALIMGGVLVGHVLTELLNCGDEE